MFLIFSESVVFSLCPQQSVGVVVYIKYDKDRPTSAAVAGEECSQASAEIHTSPAE